MHTQTPHKITILSVDDDSQDAYLLQGAFDLEQVSNPLQTVGDGEQAIVWVQHTIAPPTGEKDWIALTFEDLEDRWPQLFSRAA